MPVSDPAIPTSLVTVLIAAVVALAGVVVYLWKFYSGKIADLETERRAREVDTAKERGTWTLERASLEAKQEDALHEMRTEFEAKHRAVVEDHAKSLRDVAEQARAGETLARKEYLESIRDIAERARLNEATARKEYTDNMELVAGKAAESSDKIALVLDKIYDRFVGPRRRQ